MYHKSEIKAMVIKRDKYLNQLITSKHNGLIKIITGQAEMAVHMLKWAETSVKNSGV